MNAVFPGFFLFQQIRDADLQIFIDSNRNLIADFPIGLWGLKEKCNSLLRILSLVMKYVILDLIEVVVQGDGFCIRGKPYERKEL